MANAQVLSATAFGVSVTATSAYGTGASISAGSFSINSDYLIIGWGLSMDANSISTATDGLRVRLQVNAGGDRRQVNTLDDADAHVRSLWVNIEALSHRARQLEKLQDVWDTPWWKLCLFVLDGWPLRRVVERPQWRPWRRWWIS